LIPSARLGPLRLRECPREWHSFRRKSPRFDYSEKPRSPRHPGRKDSISSATFPSPDSRAKSSAVGKESRIARFFHHKGKDEEASKKAGEPSKDSNQEAAHEEKRHGFFHNLFHKKDKGEKKDED
jgi:hypothetical protein